jgi:hypothetical protein
MKVRQMRADPVVSRYMELALTSRDRDVRGAALTELYKLARGPDHTVHHARIGARAMDALQHIGNEADDETAKKARALIRILNDRY